MVFANPEEKCWKLMGIATSLCLILPLFATLVFCGVSCRGNSGSEESVRNTTEIRTPQLEKLPVPSFGKAPELNKIFQQRKSVRAFSNREVGWDDISLILWAGLGFKRSDDSSIVVSEATRPAPSAGRIYGLRIYVLSDGKLRLYVPEEHALLLVEEQLDTEALATAAYHQSFMAKAPCIFIITSVIEEYQAFYRERGERYVYIDTGHVAQNMLLEAEALGLGAVPIGAFDDEEVGQILGLSEKEQPVYIIPVGHYE